METKKFKVSMESSKSAAKHGVAEKPYMAIIENGWNRKWCDKSPNHNHKGYIWETEIEIGQIIEMRGAVYSHSSGGETYFTGGFGIMVMLEGGLYQIKRETGAMIIEKRKEGWICIDNISVDDGVTMLRMSNGEVFTGTEWIGGGDGSAMLFQRKNEFMIQSELGEGMRHKFVKLNKYSFPTVEVSGGFGNVDIREIKEDLVEIIINQN